MTATLLSAVFFAAAVHKDQRRKDAAKTPYVNHCIDVARQLERIGGVTDVEVLQAALLHDTVEDTQTTSFHLRELFGARVAKLVEEVTDDKSLPYAERKRLQIAHAPSLSPEAKQIKLADKLCNVADMTAQEPAAWPLSRKKEYLDWAQRVVVALELQSNSPMLTLFFTVASQKAKELHIAGLSGER